MTFMVLYNYLSFVVPQNKGGKTANYNIYGQFEYFGIFMNISTSLVLHFIHNIHVPNLWKRK